MNRKAVYIMVGTVLAGLIIWWPRGKTTDNSHGNILADTEIRSEPTIKPPTASEKSAEADGETYAYGVIRNVIPEDLELVPNYEQGISTVKMLVEKKCKSLTNSGFYGTDNKPIGWLVVEGKEISRAKNSLLFNGFVSISSKGRLDISGGKPEQEVRYGLQTGPILFRQGIAAQLSMARDKNARRMVMTDDDNSRANFFTFYDPEFPQSGPTLTDLPKLVKGAAGKEGIKVVNAVNLDGGKASVFIGPDLTLTETAPVGGWWCMKN